jgi:cysteine desulfurase
MPVYADANSTTPMPPEVVKAWTAVLDRGDPFEGSSATADATRALLNRFQRQFERDSDLRKDQFRFLFTSGAAEANISMLNTCVSSYHAVTKHKPHVVIGASEPSSIRDYVCQLSSGGRCSYSFAILDPAEGAPTAATVKAVLRPNTCLVMVSAANPITGALTNLKAIGQECFVETVANRRGHQTSKRRVPLHSDISALFARSIVTPNELLIDSYSISAHMMHGPPGFGLLAVRNSLVTSYELRMLIGGRMLNVPALAAMCAAHKYVIADRSEKNKALEQNLGGILKVLQGVFAVHSFPASPPPDLAKIAKATLKCEETQTAIDSNPNHQVAALGPDQKTQIVWFGPQPEKRLPNTLLFAVRFPCEKAAKHPTGLQLHAAIESEGVVCRTFSKPECDRHLQTLRIPRVLRGCLIRLSLLDSVDKKMAQNVAVALVRAIKNVTPSSGR